MKIRWRAAAPETSLKGPAVHAVHYRFAVAPQPPLRHSEIIDRTPQTTIKITNDVTPIRRYIQTLSGAVGRLDSVIIALCTSIAAMLGNSTKMKKSS